MSIQTRQVEYNDGDILLEAYMAWDDSSSDARPGVLISHAWAGRGEFEESKAEQLAELGYVGFALDLYGKGVKGGDPEQNKALMQPLLDDRAMLQRRMHLALEHIRKQKEVDGERVAAMGFCFGGLCVLDLARTGADIQGEFKRSSQHLNEEDMRWPYVDNRREGVLFDHQCARPADRRTFQFPRQYGGQ